MVVYEVRDLILKIRTDNPGINVSKSIPTIRNSIIMQYRLALVFYSFFKINLFILFIYFWGVLCLRCCSRAFSSCGERGLLFLVVCGLLIAMTSLIAEHGL